MVVAEMTDDGEGGTVIKGLRRAEDPLQMDVGAEAGVESGQVAKCHRLRLPHRIAGLNKHTGVRRTADGVVFDSQDIETYPRLYLCDRDIIDQRR